MRSRVLSSDIRKRVITAVICDGMSCRQAARKFKIGESTAIRWVARYRETGSYEALPPGGIRETPKIEQYANNIRARVKEAPNTTIREIVDWLNESQNFKSSYGSVWRFLKRHSISHSKKPKFKNSASKCNSKGKIQSNFSES